MNNASKDALDMYTGATVMRWVGEHIKATYDETSRTRRDSHVDDHSKPVQIRDIQDPGPGRLRDLVFRPFKKSHFRGHRMVGHDLVPCAYRSDGPSGYGTLLR